MEQAHSAAYTHTLVFPWNFFHNKLPLDPWAQSIGIHLAPLLLNMFQPRRIHWRALLSCTFSQHIWLWFFKMALHFFSEPYLNGRNMAFVSTTYLMGLIPLFKLQSWRFLKKVLSLRRISKLFSCPLLHAFFRSLILPIPHASFWVL